MTTIKLIFSAWLITFIFIATKTFISPNQKKLTTILNIILFSIILYFILNITNNTLSYILANILIILFLLIEYYKNKRVLFSAIYTIYLIRFIFEFLILYTLKVLHINNYSHILLFSITTILTLIFNYTFKDFLSNLINTKKENDIVSIFKYVLNTILMITLILIHIPNESFTIVDGKVFYILFTFITFNLTLSLFIEKNKTDDYIKNYQKIVEYTEFTEGILTEYKSFIHEYKNKLIIIKDLVKEDNKELHEYINFILNEKVNNNYHWLMDIKNIPIPGIKGLINYKLMKMKELNIAVEVYVSEEVAILNQDKLDIKEKNNLYTILGVILDNAIEASIESQEPMISLHFFKDENEINIILANTFKSINLDQLEQKGYSSKGENRGFGLYLVKEILKNSKSLAKETNIINNFFVQKIIIKNIN